MHSIRNAEGYTYRLGTPLPSSVVILRALQLGDLLCAVPAFRALRAALPAARIVLVGLPWAESFVRRFHQYLDGFIEFPGYPGLPERLPDIHAVPRFFARVQEEGFDLALQMHGSGSFVNPLVALFGARRTAGFYVKGEYCPDNDRFLPYPEHEPEVRRNLRLVEFLGIPPRGEDLEFPVTERDRADLAEVKEADGLRRGEYVCVHPGSRIATRRWEAEKFAFVADRLAATGLRVVLTGGADEVELVGRVGSAMKAPCVDLAGKTSMGALAALLKGARLLVANDTGVSHVAAALDVPSVIIVTGSDPHRWQPPNRVRHRTVFSPIDCRPCDFRRCPFDFSCSSHVTPEAVLRDARELLEKEAVYAS